MKHHHHNIIGLTRNAVHCFRKAGDWGIRWRWGPMRSAASSLFTQSTNFTPNDLAILEWSDSETVLTKGECLKRGVILTHNPEIFRVNKEKSTSAPSAKILFVDDSSAASMAARFLRQNKHGFLIYREHNDYNNARQLLTALKSRVTKSLKSPRTKELNIAQIWHHQRRWKREQTHMLNRLLLQVDSGSHRESNLKLDVPYRRAPKEVISDVVQNSFRETILSSQESTFLISLRELLGLIGSREWKRKGMLIQLPGVSPSSSKVPDKDTSLEYEIYPSHGVFMPTRREYLDLLFQQKRLPIVEEGNLVAMDVGTGTGVIAAQMLLQHRNVISHITCTDSSSSAIECARENFERLSLTKQTTLVQTNDGNMFPKSSPESKFDLITCNPPWIPGRGDSLLDASVYDPESKFLKKFLRTARQYLRDETSQVWLVISDLAERLGLRDPGTLTTLFKEGGLQVLDTSHTSPWHPKVVNTKNATKKHQMQDLPEITTARTGEVTTLYILQPAPDSL